MMQAGRLTALVSFVMSNPDRGTTLTLASAALGEA